LVLLPAIARGQGAVAYRLSFPQPEHRWMQVEVVFPDLPAAPLQIRMSRSSPGRYAQHDFAKNVFDVRFTDARGRTLEPQRDDPHSWTVAGHEGTVRVSYKVFGDRVDGTYLAIDSTHAHINMPAALLWARGLEQRPAAVRFEAPPGAPWRVATQLVPGADPLTFTAPNLQYLMDSPAEFSAFALRSFRLERNDSHAEFRVAMHYDGAEAELDAYARDAEKLAREAERVFGEYPRFDSGTYTVLADYLPWADGDGMEHRNSTVVTSPAALADARPALLGTLAHEFFHAWNVERIRPRSLEPFRFDEVNMSGELWFAEGFTSYYGALLMCRAGLSDPGEYLQGLAETINAVTLAPGRQLRSAEDMSRFAPFVDAAASIDRTAFENTYISYYTWGAAIALGLDLSLRDRTEGRVTLDHFMRAAWQQFGKSGERAAGYVERTYTSADLERVLAEISGDGAFARDFFARYVRGHEVPEYGRLLARAGVVVRPAHTGAGWAGTLQVDRASRIIGAVPFGSPAYNAGLERDDVILSIGGQAVSTAVPAMTLIRELKPGEAVPVVFERRGQRASGTLRPIADPHVDLALAENAGQSLTEAQRRFRGDWLSSQSDRVLKTGFQE
jgi:predicted metalloprotease with PDZ domain